MINSIQPEVRTKLLDLYDNQALDEICFLFVMLLDGYNTGLVF